MYVWARLLGVAAGTRRRGPFSFGDEARLTFRCLPTDIDLNMHLNNARYMALADMGRIDILLRSGLIGLAKSRGWTPLMGGVQASYVREIRLWSRFHVLSSIHTWKATQAIGKHRFVLDDGTPAATVITTAGFYEKANARFVPISELVAALGHDFTPPEMSDSEQHFLAAHEALRKETRASSASR